MRLVERFGVQNRRQLKQRLQSINDVRRLVWLKALVLDEVHRRLDLFHRLAKLLCGEVLLAGQKPKASCLDAVHVVLLLSRRTVLAIRREPVNVNPS